MGSYGVHREFKNLVLAFVVPGEFMVQQLAPSLPDVVRSSDKFRELNGKVPPTPWRNGRG
jgi:hypothetical protein